MNGANLDPQSGGPEPIAASSNADIAVVVGTYNRIEYLRRCIDSILRETKRSLKIYITDAGSTDGTIEYLNSIKCPGIEIFLIGKKLGQARAYNDVFRCVTERYVCWISDDNEIVGGGLDVAAAILDGDPRIGMVGLKVRDLQGPFVTAPYIGGISKLGILNVNQGMLPTRVMRQVGYFSLEFSDYGIDPDLTAKVLLAGYDVVYTRGVAIHHYRLWPDDVKSAEHAALMEKHRRSLQLLAEKYAELGRYNWTWIWKRALWFAFRRSLRGLFNINSHRTFMGLVPRDWNNILATRYVSIFDPIRTKKELYHFRQHCPTWQCARSKLSDQAEPRSVS